ncbi:MAG: carbohydrate kinase [Prevotella sp.]|jgi:xylulokinase|nr:carbohydrate kinase [Prevotella sp.]
MSKQYLLGLDVGSSSVKASLVNVESGQSEATTFFPETEAPIKSIKAGWAEQDPEMWWTNAKLAIAKVMEMSGAAKEEIKAVGISYQMHGLVCIDKDLKPLRDAIIWCDSRAVPYGAQAMDEMKSQCLNALLNSPGNFTVSKLAWVKENEHELYGKIYKAMLPGDYIAMKFSGNVATTISGLSEGMAWNFKDKQAANFLFDYFDISTSLLPEIVPTFGIQGYVSKEAAEETGLAQGTPISYRAGDQPNNALSLNVFNPGEIAATAGTSGVVYGVLGDINYDSKSRVNTFAHVNYTKEENRLGVLLCINGTGILNAWIHRNIAPDLSYSQMNEIAANVPVGSDGLIVMPFGNGAERMLENEEIGGSIHNLNFNKHSRAHIIRAAQEGIVFSFCYGMEIMQQMGMNISTIHAGHANMFLSPIFRETLANVSGATIELYDTDGSVGAAKGAGIGCGIYRNHDEAFATLKKLEVIKPDTDRRDEYVQAYNNWKKKAINIITTFHTT